MSEAAGAELRMLAERALQAEPGVDATAIGVSVSDAIVILGGEVPTIPERVRSPVA